MTVTSLWGADFDVPSTPQVAKKVTKKISEPKEVKQSITHKIKKLTDTSDILYRIEQIKDEVYRILGKYVNNTVVLNSREALHAYIDAAIENNIISIDTETDNSLDPITCKLMGPCIYTPGQKQAYIPINHVDVRTKQRLSNQVTEEIVKEEFARLINTDIVMHNGKFDYQVVKCTTGQQLKIYWDTMIAAKLLDENERAGLKEQYIKKIDPTIEKYSIESLFQGLPYAYFPPEIFALYAATDAYMTYKLYEYQKEIFEKPGNEKLYSLFRNIEMPVVEVVAEMELTGIDFDKDYNKVLSKKYHDKLDVIDKKLYEELDKLKPQIDAWRLTEDANYHPPKKTGVGEGKSKNEQLEDPVNFSSPIQLAILLYDVLKCKVVDKKSPRGTGEDILEKIDLPLASLLLERRAVVKLIDAFIDSLPEEINSKDNRIHCKFNQYGAATGRFSSSEPNLQQIPSHNREIRMMFKASNGNVLVSADFSQQEPRLLSCYANDLNMINAYKEGKDLYATVATGVYKKSYWECMEHNEDGSPNPEGKKRRSSVKNLLLGIMYGRGVKSIAEQIHGSVEEAQKIIDDFYQSFPNVKKWIDKTISDAHKNGYVEDLWGRRRRLDDISLPKYNIKDKNSKEDFNPLLNCARTFSSDSKVKKYQDMLSKVRSRKDYENIQNQALTEGIEIHDNTGFIAQAERQCVNARIQGGAATMTKIAMKNIYHDDILNKLGFKLLIGVHDELIGECPKENKDAAAERLSYVMKTAAEDVCVVPFKCDAAVETCWYLSEYDAMVKNEFEHLIEQGMSELDAFEFKCQDRTESTRAQLYEILRDVMKDKPSDYEQLNEEIIAYSS